MKLNPLEIAHKTFERKMFGFDEEQVSATLKEVALLIDTLLADNNTLRENLRERELDFANLKIQFESSQNAVAAANKIAEQIRLDAERQAKIIRAGASQKADEIVRDAQESLQKIYQQIADLKRTRLQFEMNLKAIAQAHLSLLDQADGMTPLNEIDL